jgi:O-antigen/teichoic acid export membrane protein
VFSQLTRLVRHSAVYTLGTILNKVLFFLLVPLYTRLLTKNEYGTLVLLNATVMVLAILYELGVTSSVMRLLFDFDEERERRRYLGSIWLAMTVATGLTSIVFAFLAKPVVKPLFLQLSSSAYLVAATWIAFFVVARSIPAVLMRVREQSTRFVTLTVAETVLLITLTVAFVWVRGAGLAGAVAALVCQALVVFVFYTVYTLRNATVGFDRGFVAKTLNYGLPVVGLHAGWWVLDVADRFILLRYTDLATVAIYSVGYALGKTLQLIATSINQAWTPFFFSIVKERDPQAKRLFAYTATYYAVILAGLGLVVVVYCREAVLIMGGPSYHAATRVTPLIVAASVIQGMFFVPSRGLFLEKKTRYFPLIVGVSGAINIGLNFVLIPKWGMMGAAWATVVGYSVAVGMTFVFAQKFYPIRYEVRRLVQVAGTFVVLSVLAQFVMGGSAADLACRTLLLLVYPVSLWVTGFLEPDEKAGLLRIVHSVRLRLGPASGRA